jgi:integrase
MPLTRQAKTLDPVQKAHLLQLVARSPSEAARNEAIVRLNFEAWLRATEIGGVRWRMVTDVTGHLLTELRLENIASKGRRGGRLIPLTAGAYAALERLYRDRPPADLDAFIIRFRKGSRDPIIRSQAVQALFRGWYRTLGFRGCSSHTGRRTGITEAARRVTKTGGSLRDVQMLAGHSSIATTQTYIDPNPVVHRKLVALTAIDPLVRDGGRAVMARASLDSRRTAPGTPWRHARGIA